MLRHSGKTRCQTEKQAGFSVKTGFKVFNPIGMLGGVLTRFTDDGRFPVVVGDVVFLDLFQMSRSEERRVGKECTSWC